jgi:hypothetical protein
LRGDADKVLTPAHDELTVASAALQSEQRQTTVMNLDSHGVELFKACQGIGVKFRDALFG